MEIMNELVQDGMDFQDEVDDSDVDKLISGMENDIHKKKMQQMEQNEAVEEEN